MKNAIVISFSVIVVILIIAGIIGFSYFNKRLTESKESKGSTEILSETGKGAVETSLPLQITSPSDQSTVTSAFITLRGKTTAQAEVFVNEKETNADPDGNFSVQLELEEGENPIMVVANDANGNVGEKEITILYEIQE